MLITVVIKLIRKDLELGPSSSRFTSRGCIADFHSDTVTDLSAFVERLSPPGPMRSKYFRIASFALAGLIVWCAGRGPDVGHSQ
jgi:hypothetical protein